MDVKANEQRLFSYISNIKVYVNQSLSSTTLQTTKLQLLCRVRSPSQGLMWVESATPHNGSSEVIGGNEPITAIHNQEKKPFTFCLLKLHWFSHCHDQFPEKQQHLFHGLCYVSDSQRTGNPCLGTWEDGSEAAAYMALSCPVASNDSIPPAGFHHHGALQCPEEHPQLETGKPEN